MPRGTPIIYKPEDQRSALVGKGLGDFFSQWMKGKTDLKREDRLMQFRHEMEEKRRSFELEKQKIDVEARKELSIMAHGFDKELKGIMQNYDMEKIQHQALQNANQRIRVLEAEGKITAENRAAALEQEYRNQKNLLLYRIAGAEQLETHKHLLSQEGLSAWEKEQATIKREELEATKGIEEKKIGVQEKKIEAGKHALYVEEAGKTARQREHLRSMEAMLDKELSHKERMTAATEALRMSLDIDDKKADVARKLMDVVQKAHEIDMDDDERQALLERFIAIAEPWGLDIGTIEKEAESRGVTGKLWDWSMSIFKKILGRGGGAAGTAVTAGESGLKALEDITDTQIIPDILRRDRYEKPGSDFIWDE